jgi:hypothetical protein
VALFSELTQNTLKKANFMAGVSEVKSLNRKKGNALITGAASGIGFELAKLLAKDGYSLLLVDLDEKTLNEAIAQLQRLSDVELVPIVQNLSSPGAALALYEKCKTYNPEILINNAGFGLFGFFSETPWDAENAMIHLHVFTLTHLTKLILPDMLKAGRGKILNVSSLAAFQPGPLMAIYYASKAFILSFSESLSNEVKGTGVTVTVLCPGLTKTNFQRQAAALSGSRQSSMTFATTSAAEVAQQAYKAMLSGKRLVIPGLFNQVTALLPRFVPRSFTLAMVRRIQDKLRN